MFTTGGKLFFALGALAVLMAVVYSLTTDALYGSIAWGTFATVFVFLGGFLVFLRDADVPIPVVADGDAVAPAAASAPPASASVWPLAGGVSAATLALGLVTDSRFFLLGVVLGICTVIEWMVQAWSDRASADPDYNATIRGGTLHAVEFPVLGAAAVGVVVLGFSRVMLALPSEASIVAFVAIAALILAVAALVASRPRFSPNLVAALLVLGAIGIVTGGIIGAASGAREFAHGAEGEAVAHGDSVREVAAKANALATITVAGEEATISYDGGRTSDELIVPKALNGNVLFVNGDNEPRRLVIEAGERATGEEGLDGTPVVEPLEFATQFVEPGKTNFLTFRIPNEGEYEFRVEGEEGAQPITGRLLVS